MIFRIRITGFIEVDINSFKIAVDYVGIKRKSIMLSGFHLHVCIYSRSMTRGKTFSMKVHHTLWSGLKTCVKNEWGKFLLSQGFSLEDQSQKIYKKFL